jgi:tetratricopeptide (TPR) repeat protein
MLKSQKNLQKSFVNTRIRELVLLTFTALFFYACAAAPPRITPRTDLGDPLRGTDLAPTPEYQKAYGEYLQGNPQEARELFFKITAASPDYYPAYLALGYTYLAEDNREYAESYVRKALEVNPDYAQAHYVLSNLLEARNDNPGALQQLNEVARIDPQFPALAQAQNVLKLKVTEQYMNTGRELAERDPEEALKYLKAAHDMAPEVAQIPVEIAAIFLKQDNCAEAVPYLKIAVEKTPEDLQVKRNLADCFVQLGDYQEARTIYEDLSIQIPGDREVTQRLEEIRKRLFVESLPSEFQSIQSAPEITRAQLAAYMVIYLEFLQKYRSENQQIVVDIIQHWAQSYMQKVVSLGIMDVYPNRTFQPNQPVSKLELAKAASRILEIIELSGQGKFPPDPTLSIPDIPAGHLYYRLVARPLAARVISLDADGRFHASRRVSGAEAISVVNQLRALTEPL